MIILGVDPGLVTTGYGVVEIEGPLTRVVEAGAIRTSDADPLEVRLQAIHAGLVAIMEDCKPEVVCVEEVYSKYAHPRTAILMGHARGVICLAAGLQGVPLHQYAATRIKNAVCGHGRASKEQMQKMVQHRLDLTKVPQPNDVADALAVALCHANECFGQGALRTGSRKAGTIPGAGAMRRKVGR